MTNFIFYGIVCPILYGLERIANKGEPPPDPIDSLLGGIAMAAIALVGAFIVTFLFY
jgi:hypothetical protein